MADKSNMGDKNFLFPRILTKELYTWIFEIADYEYEIRF